MGDYAKLDDSYTFRIPSYTKQLIQKLPEKDKRDLNERLLLEIAKKLHEANFDPKVYLGE